MIFVSYSHRDKEWCARFKAMAKPLERYAGASFWSDADIKPGEKWPDKIRNALDSATIAVLLVSVDFLASEFIFKEELPRILKASEKGSLQVLWILLSPCHYKLTGLRDIHAVTDVSAPLNSMGQFGYQSALLTLCDRIDEIIRKAETPVINDKLRNQKLDRVQPKLQVLAKPAFRETEILIFAGGKWHPQGRVAKGSMTAHCWIGDDKHTKSGDAFRIVAITRDAGSQLGASSHLHIPKHRAKSGEVTVIRK